jgi:hypothetical protein
LRVTVPIGARRQSELQRKRAYYPVVFAVNPFAGKDLPRQFRLRC